MTSIVHAQTIINPFVLSLTGFRSMEKPIGTPLQEVQAKVLSSDPTLTNAQFDYYGVRPKYEGDVQTGNCCIQGQDKEVAQCGKSGTCCAVCQVTGSMPESAQTRFHYILSVEALSNQSPPQAAFSEIVKLLHDPNNASPGVNTWRRFDYFGQVSTSDEETKTGTCCIRGKREQIRACGSAGYCCASCVEASIGMKTF